MNWMVPFTRLDTYQKSVISKLTTTQTKDWIKGFAGSGKTVILIHFIREMKQRSPQLSICCVVYTHALKDLVQTGLTDGLEDIPVVTYHQFLTDRRRYDIVVVDEVQDIPRNKLLNIKRYCDRIIVGGDTDQSIYENGISELELKSLLNPEIHELKMIYRLTEKLKRLVQSILPGSLIANAEINKGSNVDITLAKASSYENEVVWVCKNALEYSSSGDPSVILFKKHSYIKKFIKKIVNNEDLYLDTRGLNKTEIYEAFNALMENEDLPYRFLGNDIGELTDSDNQQIVYIMTYHSVKGLDFDAVFLPGMNDNVKPFNQDHELDRHLFFVACTRSRENLFLSYFDKPHEYITNMPQDALTKIECSDPSTSTDKGSLEDFIF